MDKIQDISTNTRKLNKQIRALGVNVTDDASLADMSTNISLIDTSAHPDLDLPWVMADGSSGFLMDVQVTKNRSSEFKGRIVPMYDTEDNYASNHGILGTKWTGSACWGIDQMRYNFRMRERMDKSPGLSADSANNYVGLDNLWSETSNPFWYTITIKQSHYDNSGYRASQYVPSSSTASGWTHAASNLAQASSSNWNLTPIGVFDRFYVTDKDSWKMEMLTGCAKKGTMCEYVKVGNGTYSGTWSDTVTYSPCLHWDVSTGKYRPCLYAAATNGRRYTSFPISANMNYDDGSDHMYYYELDKGIQPLEYPTWNETYPETDITTDIPYSTSYTYVVKADAYVHSSHLGIVMSTSGTVKAGLSFYQQSTGSSGTFGFRCFDGNNNDSYQYIKTTAFSSGAKQIIAKIKYGTTMRMYWRYSSTGQTQTTALNTYSNSTNGNSYRTGDRGNMVFRIGMTNTSNTNSGLYRFYWCYIFDSNMNVIHYLVPVKHNDEYKLYDVITKKLYTAQ